MLVIGSWKMKLTPLPRTERSSRSGAPIISRPPYETLPDTRAEAGSRETVESALTDFPEPLSPTSATVSPRSTENDTPRTAGTSRPSSRNATFRSLTSSRLIRTSSGDRRRRAPPRT